MRSHPVCIITRPYANGENVFMGGGMNCCCGVVAEAQIVDVKAQMIVVVVEGKILRLYNDKRIANVRRVVLSESEKTRGAAYRRRR